MGGRARLGAILMGWLIIVALVVLMVVSVAVAGAQVRRDSSSRMEFRACPPGQSLRGKEELALAEGGNSLVVACKDAITVWDLRTGRPGPSLQVDRWWRPDMQYLPWVMPGMLTIRPTKPVVAFPGSAGVEMWNWRTGERTVFASEPGVLASSEPVDDFGFTPDGSKLVTVAPDWENRIDIDTEGQSRYLWWDADTGKILRSPEGTPEEHPDAVSEMIIRSVYSADGSLAAMIDEYRLDTQDRQVQIRDTTSGSLLSTVPGVIPAGPGIPNDREFREWPVFADLPAFSPDGRQVLVISYVGAVVSLRPGPIPSERGDDGLVCAAQLWDVQEGRTVRELPGRLQFCLGTAWTSDGRLVLVATDDGVHVWDAATGQSLRRIAPGGLDSWTPWRPPIRQLLLAPDGRTLTTLDDDGVVAVWDLPPREVSALDSSGSLLQAFVLLLYMMGTATYTGLWLIARGRSDRDRPVPQAVASPGTTLWTQRLAGIALGLGLVSLLSGFVGLNAAGSHHRTWVVLSGLVIAVAGLLTLLGLLAATGLPAMTNMVKAWIAKRRTGGDSRSDTPNESPAPGFPHLATAAMALVCLGTLILAPSPLSFAAAVGVGVAAFLQGAVVRSASASCPAMS